MAAGARQAEDLDTLANLEERITRAVELVVQLRGDKQALVSESADLLYHWLVVLGIAGIPLDDVLKELEGRTGRSGITEKASRPRG